MKLKKIFTLALAFVMVLQTLPPNLITVYADDDHNSSAVQASTQIDLTHKVRPSQAAEGLTLHIGQPDESMSTPLTFQLVLDRDFLTTPAFDISDNAENQENQDINTDNTQEPNADTNANTDVDNSGENAPEENATLPADPDDNQQEPSGTESITPDPSPENTTENNDNPTVIPTAIGYEVLLSGPFSTELNFNQQGYVYFDGFEMGTYSISFSGGETALFSVTLNEDVYTTLPSQLVSSVQIYLEGEYETISGIEASIIDNAVAFSLINKADSNNINEGILPIIEEGSTIMATTFGAVMQSAGFSFGLFSGGTNTTTIDITEHAYPTAATMPASFAGAPDAFSEVLLSVGKVDDNNKLSFSLNAEFNPDFLYWAMETFVSVPNIHKNNPPDLTISFDIANSTTGAAAWPQPPDLQFPYDETINFYYNDDILIGTIKFEENGSNTTVKVEFNKEAIYGASEAEAYGEFSATLSNNAADGLIAGLVNNPDGSFGVDWSTPPPVDFGDKDYVIEKEALRKNIDSPYINYEITVYAKDDLAGTKIVDIFGLDSDNLGLTPLSFSYQLYNNSSPVGGSGGTIALSDTDPSYIPDKYLFINDSSIAALDPFSHNFISTTNYDPGTGIPHPGTVFVFDPAQHLELPGEKITKAVISISAMIDQNAYAKLSTAMKLNHTFKNVAAVYHNDGSSAEHEKSNEVASPVQMDFLAKDGKRLGLNGEKMEWTIKGSTYLLMTNNDAYIVDMIPNNNIHEYDVITGIKLNGTTIAIDDTIPGPVNEDFSSLATADNVKALLESLLGAGNLPDGTTEAYTFESSTPDQSLLIISLGKDAVNKPFTLTYNTELQAGAGDYDDQTMKNYAKLLISPNVYYYGKGPGTHVKLPEVGGEIDKTTTVRNGQAGKEAGFYDPANQTMVWNIFVNDKKEVITNFLIEETFDMTKEFILKIGKYSFAELNDPAKIGQSFDIGSPGTSMVKIDPDVVATPLVNSFSIKTNGNYVTIRFYFTGISKDDWYFIPITTRLVDTDVLSKQLSKDGTPDLTNTIKYGQYTNTNTTVTAPVTATKDISNTLITKEVVFPTNNKDSAFDYTNGTVNWKITVNPNSLSIKDPVITDLLPAELELAAAPKAYFKGSEADLIVDNTGSMKYTETPYPASYTTKNIVEFKFDLSGEVINKPLIIEYSTKFKDIYMPEMSADKVELIDTNALVNQCYLDGNIGLRNPDDITYADYTKAIDSDYIALSLTHNEQQKYDYATKSAADSATAPINFNPVTKTGEYIKKGTTTFDNDTLTNVELMRWQIVINKARLSPMENMVITDTNESNFVEFNPESVKVYLVELDSNGKVITTDDPDLTKHPQDITTGLATGMITTKSEGKIVFEAINDKLDGKVFMIEYDALFIKDGSVKGADVANSVGIENCYKDATVTGDHGHADGQTVRASSLLTYLPGIRIAKASTNTAYNTTTFMPVNHLAGVEFKLEAYDFDPSGNLTPTTLTPRTATTDANGIANFIFLKKGLIYRLTENLSSTGNAAYNMDAKPRYIALSTGNPINDASTYPSTIIDGVSPVPVEIFKPGETSVFFDPRITAPTIGTNTHNIKTIPLGLENATVYDSTFVMLNSPISTSGFSFKKYDERPDTGTPDNVTEISGIIFELEYTDSKGDIKRTISSTLNNTDGVISFSELDPNTYTMTEKDNANYATLGTYTVTVPVDPNDPTTIVSITPASGTAGQAALMVPDGLSTDYRIINYVPRGDVSIVKRAFVDNGNHNGAFINNAAFNVYNASNDTLVAKLVPTGSNGKYKLAPTGESATDIAKSTFESVDIPYLIEKFDKAGEYLLLPGTYYIVETYVPAGYEAGLESNGGLPDATRALTVTSADHKKYYMKIEGGKTATEVYTDLGLTEYVGKNKANSYIPNYPNNLEIKILKNSNQNNHTIPGITFNLYEYNSAVTSDVSGSTIPGFPLSATQLGSLTPIATKATDPSGNLTLKPTGGGLVEGKYIVVEVPDSASAEFKTPAGGPTQYLVELKSNTSNGVLSSIVGAYEADGVNPATITNNTLVVRNLKELARGKVRLIKIGIASSTTLLEDAEFIVYDDNDSTNTPVGIIKWDAGATGTNKYRISPAPGNPEKGGVPYLAQPPGYSTEYELLPGEYTVYETKAPINHVIMGHDGLPYIETTPGVSKFNNLKRAYTLVIPTDADDTPIDVIYKNPTGFPAPVDKTKLVNLLASSGKIEGTKVARNGTTPLSGAVFTLYIKPDNAEYPTFAAMDAQITAGTHADILNKYIVGVSAETGPLGQFEFTGLADGKYILVETKYPKEHKDTKIRVYITIVGGAIVESTFMEAGVPNTVTGPTAATISLKNERKISRGAIELTKKDIDTPANLLSGAEFEVYTDIGDKFVAYLTEKTPNSGVYTLSKTNTAGSTGKFDATLSTIIDGESYLYLDEFTEYGGLQLLAGESGIKYYILETIAPDGYHGYAENGSDIYYDGFVPTGVTRHKFEITIPATPTLKTTVISPIIFNTEHSDKSIKGYKFTASGEIAVKGVVMGLYSINNLDKNFNDGTLTKLLVGQTTTDEDGMFEFINLPFGKYVVKEIDVTHVTSPVAQYTLSPQEYRFEVDALGVNPYMYLPEGDVDDLTNNVSPFDPDEIEFYNERVNKRSALELTLTSTNATADILSNAQYMICLKGRNEPVAYLLESSTTPGTYVLSDVSADGTPLASTHNASGVAFLSMEHGYLELLAGEYEITEIAYPTAHRGILAYSSVPGISHTPDMARNIADRVKIDLTLEKDDYVVSIPDKNMTTPGRVDGSSIVNTGASLAGVKLGVFSVGTTVFTDANSILDPVIADANGNFSFTNLPVGMYIIKAIEGVNGYITDMEPHTFEVTGTNLDPVTGEEIITKFADGTPLNIISMVPSSGGVSSSGMIGNKPGGTPTTPVTPTPVQPPKTAVVPPATVTPPATTPATPEAPAIGGGDVITPATSESLPAAPEAPVTPAAVEASDITAPTEADAKPLSEVAVNEVETPAALPDGYKAVKHEDNVYIVYNEIGMPVGYVVLENGKTLDNFNLDDILPFGNMSVKSNPKTGVDSNMGYNIAFLLIAISVVLLKPFLTFKKSKKTAKRKLPIVI